MSPSGMAVRPQSRNKGMSLLVPLDTEVIIGIRACRPADSTARQTYVHAGACALILSFCPDRRVSQASKVLDWDSRARMGPVSFLPVGSLDGMWPSPGTEHLYSVLLTSHAVRENRTLVTPQDIIH